MPDFDAYCAHCEIVVKGKADRTKVLESGNSLYLGQCPICSYDIRRIVRQER